MIKRRNMMTQILLTVITLGIYTIYWFYSTTKEIVAYKKLDGNVGLWTFLYLIPIVNYFSYWKHGKAVEALTDSKYNAVLIFLAWIVFSPVVWFLTQSELNKRASA